MTSADGKEKFDMLIDVTGDGRGSVFLVTGEANILYEAGMAYCAGAMVERVAKALGDRPLDAVFLSHSHYDHVAGLPYVRKQWPGVKVYASELAKEILVRPHALAIIRNLSHEAAKAAGADWDGVYRDEDLRVDTGLSDGQCLTIGDHRILAVETIGHTKCSMVYKIDDILFLSETIGVMSPDGQYIPAFLVDYKRAMDSIERVRKIPAKTLVLSHYGPVRDEDRDGIWDWLETELRESKDKMIGILNSCRSEEERLAAMERTFHATISKKDQPDAAFFINAASMLKTLQRQFPEEVRP